ncbi:MAG: tRNA pseudouridine(38-40) synthase TruA [Clostridia bacterium]|nr:tRNA pseudouridine(38-40) synthase TruA [Clostridia bacterium]
MKYVLKVAYDGTNYAGWQVQRDVPTIQEALEKAVKSLTGCDAVVTGSGRTDAGVHAKGQVCCFSADSSIPPERMADALNSFLPDDISVLECVEGDAAFDPVRAAKRKTYAYKIYNAPHRDPLRMRYFNHISQDIDTHALFKAANFFTGVHDFKAYCASGSSAKTTVREIYNIGVDVAETVYGREITIYVTGNGFLYNMVRTIVGTMVGYSFGIISKDRIKLSLETGDRKLAGKTFAAKGLCLHSVEYEEDPFDPDKEKITGHAIFAEPEDDQPQ